MTTSESRDAPTPRRGYRPPSGCSSFLTPREVVATWKAEGREDLVEEQQVRIG